MSVCVVDSNFFIQAHRVSYPLDIAFSFWNKVKQLADEGKIISIGQTALSIGDIAFKMGQLEPSVFSRFFKSKTNMTPQQFRQT